MAVVLAKAPCRTEVVNDLHGDLINLIRIIQHPKQGPALYRRLRRVLASEELFDHALVTLDLTTIDRNAGPDLDRAFAYFISSWQGRNGNAGLAGKNANFSRRFGSGGGDSAARWVGAVNSIPAWRRRLERVQVLRSNAFHLLARIVDERGTAIYCDPPYLVKKGQYVHDFSATDHARLAESLRRFSKAKVVLSYYDHPMLSTLYPGWHVRHLNMTKLLANQNGGDGTSAPEVLLTNIHS